MARSGHPSRLAAMGARLGVSKAEYDASADRQPSARRVADAALLKRIRTVHFGSPRVHADLREQHSRKRITRLMREAGLVGSSHRRGGPVTTQLDREARPAPNLVDRNFAAVAPNRLWVVGITDVPTASGFLYLAVVLDAFSCRIVGWARRPSQPAAMGTRHDQPSAVGVRLGRPGDGRHPAQARRRDSSFGSGGTPWVRSAMPTTTPWPSASSRPSSANS